MVNISCEFPITLRAAHGYKDFTVNNFVELYLLNGNVSIGNEIIKRSCYKKNYEWIKRGRCPYCGAHYGFINKTCKNCGQKRVYL